MSSIADEYENWFNEGNRDLALFLSDRSWDDQQFLDCLLTDQYLRHHAGDEVDPQSYANRFQRVANNRELQIELWLDVFGFLEQTQVISESTRQSFLAKIPDAIRSQVALEVQGEPAETLPPVDSLPSFTRYRIEEEIGRGTFGIVYRAWDQQLERPVAIKVIQSVESSDHLFAEARLVAKLDVPGVVSVYDCGIESSGRGFLVTALLDGPDLNQWTSLVDHQDYKTTCRLFAELCKALQAAHACGIVHRDIKPTNIIVCRGNQPVILDFGLALGEWKPGREGELVGTPAYMSPEQARGEGHLIDARSDIFSIGILLIESLTGRRPWQSSSSRQLVREIAHGHAQSARQLDHRIPVALERICSKATASVMSQRYSSAAEMEADLRWFCADAKKVETHSENRVQMI